MLSEDSIIEIMENLTRGSASKDSALKLGIGDDTALFQTAHLRGMLATTDMLIEGVHFLSSTHDYRRIGRKCIHVNTSDIAAMGGKPLYALISFALPRGMQRADLENLCAGMQDACKEFGIAIIGGDTNATPGPLTINVCMLGEPHPRQSVFRSGAKLGDIVAVTGSLGGSFHSGKHLDFVPRVYEAQMMLDLCPLHAMMDLSDGVAKDLQRLCKASQLGAEVRAESLPISANVDATLDDFDRIKHAIGDGEDFELLFTVSDAQFAELKKQLPFEIFAIGKMTNTKKLMLSYQGKVQAMPELGFTHNV